MNNTTPPLPEPDEGQGETYREQRERLEAERRKQDELYAQRLANLDKARAATRVKGASGRNLKFFMPYVTEKIIDAIRSGATQQLAAQYAGISSVTLAKWLKEGENADEDSPLHQFYIDFHKARGEKAKVTLERIEEIANNVNSWQGLAWILERSFPKDFGKSMYGGDPSEPPEIKHVIEVIREPGDSSPQIPEGTRATRYQLSGPEMDGEESTEGNDADVTKFPTISPAD